MDISTQTLSAAASVADPMAAAGRVVTLPIKADPAVGGNAAAASLAPAAQPSAAALKEAVASGTKALQQINQALEFQIDDKSKQSVVKIVDTQTQEVIRQIPSVEFLQIAQNIDAFQARLLHEKA